MHKSVSSITNHTCMLDHQDNIYHYCYGIYCSAIEFIHSHIRIRFLRLFHKDVGFIIHPFYGTTGQVESAATIPTENTRHDNHQLKCCCYFCLLAIPLVCSSVKTMKLLKMPQKRPEYRKNRSHENFLTPLSSHVIPNVNKDRQVSFLLSCLPTTTHFDSIF